MFLRGKYIKNRFGKPFFQVAGSLSLSLPGSLPSSLPSSLPGLLPALSSRLLPGLLPGLAANQDFLHCFFLTSNLPVPCPFPRSPQGIPGEATAFGALHIRCGSYLLKKFGRRASGGELGEESLRRRAS